MSNLSLVDVDHREATVNIVLQIPTGFRTNLPEKKK